MSTPAPYVVIERGRCNVLGTSPDMDGARDVVRQWRSAGEGWPYPASYGKADIYQLAEPEDHNETTQEQEKPAP